MNRVVCVECNADKEFGIEDPFIAFGYRFDGHRVHVMNNDFVVDLIAFEAKIASKISGDHNVSYVTPLR
jgi:hypothetical protein